MVSEKTDMSKRKAEDGKYSYTLASAFSEASKISFSLVIIPIAILLIGIKIDKTFSTTPLFIAVTIILGFVYGIYKASRLKKKLQITKK